MTGRKIQVEKKTENPPHPLYRAFNNSKSAMIEVARQIAETSKEKLPPDVQFIIDTYGKKPA